MRMSRFAGLLFAAALMSPAFAGTPAAAPAMAPKQDKTQDIVLAPFHAFVDATNRGDTKAAAAPYARGAVIIDEFAPFMWRGKAFAGWYADLGSWAKANGIAGLHIATAAPAQFETAKDTAYAIVPTHLTFTAKGKPASEDGTFTVSLKHYKSGWRIAGWAWTTKH